MKTSARTEALRSRRRAGYGSLTKLELIAALRARDDARDTPQEILDRQAEEHRMQLELQNQQLSDAHAALESRHRYADLYDMAPVGYVTFDGKGCIRELNRTACDLLGYSTAHVTGKPFIAYLAQPDRKIFLQHLWECRRDGRQRVVTLRLINRAGIERLVELITRPAHDFESKAGWCRTAIIDVTDRRATEAALSASEAKFRLMAENIGDVFWFMELDPPRLTYVSPAFERVWGIRTAEVCADQTLWEKSIHPDDLADVESAFDLWIRGEADLYRVEYRVIHQDGSIRWLADRGIVISRKDGRPFQISGIARDITERKLNEETLAAKARERRAILEGAFDGILIADVETLRFTYGNEAICRMLGVTREELLTMGVKSIHPAESLPDLLPKFEAMARGELSVAENVPVQRKDGSITRVDISTSPVVINGRRCNVGIFHDITERQRAEESFRSLLESAPDAMMIHGTDGRIQIVNAQAEKLFGYPRDELTGRTMEMLMPGRFRQLHVQHRQSYTPSSKPRPMGVGKELLALHKDGTEIPVEISLSNLSTNGTELVISSIRDITQRMQAEEELRASQRFALSTLEAIPACLAVLDESGTIISTNESWTEFARNNCGHICAAAAGMNYLDVCDSSSGGGAEAAARFAAGIRGVLDGSLPRFEMEYPCHSHDEKRWFVGYVTPFKGEGPRRVVIAHLDISQRKRAEMVIRRLNDELELRVEMRTRQLNALNEELKQQITARLRLEEEILAVSEREQQRIGQDLHDDLGQRLAGAWMMSTVLAQTLAREAPRSLPYASGITDLLKSAVAMTRSLARGLHPVAPEPGGLMAALRDLTVRMHELFQIKCRFNCPADVLVEDNTTATHLYRIAQEAVTNAVKHGHARNVGIRLLSDAETTTLSINDDGGGIGPLDPKRHGMGLRIMHYRADMIGATIRIEKQKSGGTRVTCTLPTPPALKAKEPPTDHENTRKTRNTRKTGKGAGAREEKAARRR